MKSLFLTSEQAASLAEDLKEYCAMKDSSNREVIKSFEIRFGDLLAKEPMPAENFEVFPNADFLLVEGSN